MTGALSLSLPLKKRKNKKKKEEEESHGCGCLQSEHRQLAWSVQDSTSYKGEAVAGVDD